MSPMKGPESSHQLLDSEPFGIPEVDRGRPLHPMTYPTHLADGTVGVKRDAANRDPFTEVALLRDSGLLPLLVPEQFGGAGWHWETAFAAVRIIATTAGSIPQLLACHCVNQSSIASYATPANQGSWWQRSAAAGWLWATR